MPEAGSGNTDLNLAANVRQRPNDQRRAAAIAVGDDSRSDLPAASPFELAEGAPASFVAFDRNPIEDLESITRISLRVKEGRELSLAR